MAELVGLAASIVGLAGAAATVSLTLFECGRNWANANKELASLATEVSDLSTILEYLVEVLKIHEKYVATKATETVHLLVMRCGNVLEELKVAAELVKAKFTRMIWLFRKSKILEHKANLKGFKSNLQIIIQTLILAKAIQQESKQYVDI